MRIGELYGRQGGEPKLFLGRVKTAPDDVEDTLLAIVDAFDKRFEWQAAGWAPHADDWPSKDDHVLLARIAGQTIVVAWWPR